MALRSSSLAKSLGKSPRKASSRWFVYVARCADGTLYTGIARDVAARIAQHDAGKGARYTRGRGPLKLLGAIRCKGQGDALRLELSIKALPRAAKVAAITEARKKRRRAVRASAAG